MLDLLLNPGVVLGALFVAALLTPLAAVALKSRFPRGSLAVVGGAGPFALALWGLHSLLIRYVGFDSIFTPMILVIVAAVVGLVAGRVWGTPHK